MDVMNVYIARNNMMQVQFMQFRQKYRLYSGYFRIEEFNAISLTERIQGLLSFDWTLAIDCQVRLSPFNSFVVVGHQIMLLIYGASGIAIGCARHWEGTI